MALASLHVAGDPSPRKTASGHARALPWAAAQLHARCPAGLMAFSRTCTRNLPPKHSMLPTRAAQHPPGTNKSHPFCLKTMPSTLVCVRLSNPCFSNPRCCETPVSLTPLRACYVVSCCACSPCTSDHDTRCRILCVRPGRACDAHGSTSSRGTDPHNHCTTALPVVVAHERRDRL